MKFQIISCNIILNLSQFLIGEITNLFVYAIPYPLPADDADENWAEDDSLNHETSHYIKVWFLSSFHIIAEKSHNS